MLLSEVIDYILIDSGQFYFVETSPDPLACLGFTREQFWTTIGIRQLNKYQRYRPLTGVFNRTATSVGHLGQSTVIFSKDTYDSSGLEDSSGTNNGLAEDPGIVDRHDVWDGRVGVLNRDIGLVPEWISDVHPTVTLSSAGIFYLLQISSFINTGEYSRLREPRTYLWHYEHDDNNGILYCTEIGRVQITAHYKYPYVESRSSDGILDDVNIFYLEDFRDFLFIDLCTARLMISIGRSRRGFQLDGNPVQYDAQALIEEGTALEEKSLAILMETSNWYDAIGT